MSKRNEAELKNAVLADYLMLKRGAIEAKRSGNPWLGLLDLKTLICSVPISDESKPKKKEIIDIIEKIQSNSVQVSGPDKETTDNKRQIYRNLKALDTFDNVLNEITELLKSENYFEFLKIKFGPRIEDVDMSTAVKV